MSDEVTVRESLVQISWYLNYRDGEEVTVEEISEETGIPWAMVHNCLITLKKIQRLTPPIVETEDGYKVNSGDTLFEDAPVQLVVYMLTQRKQKGEITEPFNIEKHSYLKKNPEAVAEAESLGWIEWDGENSITLTPTGVKVAGPTHSELENLD